MTIAFWINDPSILFNKDYIFELWPSPNMCYEQKLNAISRLILLLTILGYILTKSYKIVVVGLLTMIGIFLLFTTRKEKLTKEMLQEGFLVDGSNDYKIKEKNISKVNSTTMNPVTLETVLKTKFKEGNKKNPFSNVLLTEIMDSPERKSAPPAFNPDVDEDITKNVMRSVQRMNSGIDNTNHQLYDSLWDKFDLDQSNRVFYSTANTQVQPGDQASFGKYLYGEMPSSKESNALGAWQREKDSYRYTLY
jgi:hypothetical protein